MITAIGPHRVCCASVDSPEVDVMLEGHRAEIIYVDPPWGEVGVVNWSELRRRQTGELPPPITFSDLIERILGLAERHLDGHLIMEMGKTLSGRIAGQADEYFPKVRVFHNDVNDVITAGDEPFPRDLTGLAGRELERAVVGAVAKPGAIVFDPCCGCGLTAHAALDNGMVFYGNEFNKNRLRHTLFFLYTREGEARC